MPRKSAGRSSSGAPSVYGRSGGWVLLSPGESLVQAWAGATNQPVGLAEPARRDRACLVLLESGETDVSVSLNDRGPLGGRSCRLGDLSSGN